MECVSVAFSHLSRVTVIIPVYNTAPYLRRCLDSVCGQTYRNLEIICVNDGSTDDSQSILEEYAARDERVRVLVQENSGQAVARNRALDVAQGEYVLFVDSDDWIERITCETILCHMEDRVDILYFGIIVDEMKNPERLSSLTEHLRIKFEGRQKVRDELFLGTNAYVAGKFYRMSLLKKHGIRFPEGLRYEDSAMFYNSLAVAENVFFLPRLFYHYMQREDSTMGQTYAKTAMPLQYIPIVRYIFHFYESHGIAQKWMRPLENLFCSFYTIAAERVREDFLPQLQEDAFLLAVEMRIAEKKYYPAIQSLRKARMGHFEKLFHQCFQNRDSYGLAHFAFYTIVHTRESETHYCCGLRLFSRRNLD